MSLLENDGMTVSRKRTLATTPVNKGIPDEMDKPSNRHG